MLEDTPTREALQDAGWTEHHPRGFTGYLGSLWKQGEPDNRQNGFFVTEEHSNTHLGTLHGGAFMTFADVCLGLAIADAIGGPHCATVNLNMHYVSTVKLGTFVYGQPRLIKRTSNLAFVHGLFFVGEKTVARADGIWKIFPKPDA